MDRRKFTDLVPQTDGKGSRNSKQKNALQKMVFFLKQIPNNYHLVLISAHKRADFQLKTSSRCLDVALQDVQTQAEQALGRLCSHALLCGLGAHCPLGTMAGACGGLAPTLSAKPRAPGTL